MKTRNKTIRLQFSLLIICQIAEGVNFLHNTLNVAHRDLKPENVFILLDNKNGDKIKLGDFGLGKAVDTMKVNKYARIHKLTASFQKGVHERFILVCFF